MNSKVIPCMHFLKVKGIYLSNRILWGKNKVNEKYVF